jgi:RecA-family ATPase
MKAPDASDIKKRGGNDALREFLDRAQPPAPSDEVQWPEFSDDAPPPELTDQGKDGLRSVGIRETSLFVSDLSRGVIEPYDLIFSAKLARDAPKREQAKANQQQRPGTGPSTDAETPPMSKPVVFRNDWLNKSTPERRQVVRNRIYRGTSAILSGDGGLGKTNLALQLGVSVALGFGWLNAVVEEQGPVLFYSAEEEDDEIERRVRRIAEHHNLSPDNTLRDLRRHCRPDDDAVLGAPDRNRIIKPTRLFNELLTQACDLHPALVIIEAAADVFAGNEIARSEVRQFMALLRKLAIRSDAAVLLLQHPSLTGLKEGTGTSGNTHWRNSARTFLNFTRPNKEDVRELSVTKNNYGPTGEVVPCQWQNGVFVPVGAGNPLERTAAAAAIDDAFLRCVDAVAVQKRSASPNKGSTYAPRVFEQMPEAAGSNRKALGEAMERLFAAGRIEGKLVGPPSKQRTQIARAGGSDAAK